MRILELRFKNLNSLYGEWSIDFTQPEYARDGIFVITGPTGAGKSTLLDAVCLALYGRTPRLKSISKSGNEIMSRRSGECFSEVTFETASGRFLSHWSQRRAYLKPGGNLGASRHEISDAATGRILASKKRDTAACVIKETGMDFDRFTRSMMLAQGGFAAFLQAAPDERAPILEQITGTKIYSRISQEVHERLKAENARLEMMTAKLDGIRMLSPEDEAGMNQELSEKRAQEKDCLKQQESLQLSMAWLGRIRELTSDLALMEKASGDLAEARKDFEGDRVRLNQGLKSAEMEGIYTEVSAGRRQYKSDIETLERLRASLPGFEKALAEKETDLKSARQTVEAQELQQKTEVAIIRQVRAMDLELSQKKEIRKTFLKECSRIRSEITANKKQQDHAEKQLAKAQKKAAALSSYLTEHAGDAGLSEALAAVREKMHRLGDLADQAMKLSRQAGELSEAFDTENVMHKRLVTASRSSKKRYDQAIEAISKIEEETASLMGERSITGYRREHEGLLREMAYKRRIADLEKERGLLTDGKACPLCGSLEHPFASGQVPKADETEWKIEKLAAVIKAAEQLAMRLDKAREKEKQAGTDQASADRKELESRHRKDHLSREINRIQKELNTAQKRRQRFEKELIETLKPYGITSISENSHVTLFQSLEKRLVLFQERQTENTQNEKKMIALDGQVKQGCSLMERLGRDLDRKTAELEAHETGLDTLSQERVRQYGQKDPDAEEARLASKLDAARRLEYLTQKEKEALLQETAACKAKAGSLRKIVDAGKERLEGLEKKFVSRLEPGGFKDEAEFLSCRLLPEEKRRLENQAEKLDKQQQDLDTRKKDREELLEKEFSRKVTTLTMEQLQAESDKIRDALKELGEGIGALKQKLSDNQDAKRRLKTQLEEIAALKKERSRWETLHVLIGSADGKKYRNFAQGITFELMVSQANQQLDRMSDRYLLVRDEKQPLELNVVDDYQAGEIRSTKNLSGGESFIVSLSLALGLSSMSSGKVSVDSLFLDEGFGTLDEDALETALQALSGLNRSGKLVGLISHVQALKDSISTQITISPESGGKSHIRGPGCRRM